MTTKKLENIVSIPLKCSGSVGSEYDVRNPVDGIDLPIHVTQVIKVYNVPDCGHSVLEGRVICLYYSHNTSGFGWQHVCNMSEQKGECRYCFDPKVPHPD